jgi:hypothetical protein
MSELDSDPHIPRKERVHISVINDQVDSVRSHGGLRAINGRGHHKLIGNDKSILTMAVAARGELLSRCSAVMQLMYSIADIHGANIVLTPGHFR